MINQPPDEHCTVHGMVSVAAPTVVIDGPSDGSPVVSAPERRRALSREDATRFRSMVDGHFDFIWRSLRGLGVPSAMIDDAAQQVFWTASQKLDTIVVGSERSFLFATARGVAANARRSRLRSRELPDEEAVASYADHSPDPEQVAASRQARRLLDRILDGLPEELREVFVLYELEGQTMAEIATLLATPTGTIASRLRRAREEFHTAARRHQANRGNET
ncbi:MAG: polymerase sigma factor RpoE [Labilithrix sp.]|nr:polymerase sigma factor RpoE [Labilithrix sp.]